ncbi:hypothetical protein Syun_016346 [Stephania yunnanensis]|uniref:Uncharacterized protein n=1 Tax=Stephania yunnanensis TaxID=152371 RepID=A0AAP0J504_9MAGN
MKVCDRNFIVVDFFAIGEVKYGKFKVALPNEIVDNNGQLREEWDHVNSMRALATMNILGEAIKDIR